MDRIREISLEGQKKYSLLDRPSIVNQATFFQTGQPKSVNDFIDHLPDILQAKALKELLTHCQNAYKNNKPIIIAIGGHIIKCGLSPLLIEMIDLGVIRGVSGNGSVTIHDFELALAGSTSEDVAKALEDGSFGMARETGEEINLAIIQSSKNKLGYGEGLGKYLNEKNPKYLNLSIVASAYRKKIPFTVHVAVGTDIIHQHKEADGAAIGDCSMRDFRYFCNLVKELDYGGIFLNLGSAVIMPEVFLKAVTVVRNLGYPLSNFYTAVFDMNMHYRPRINVVERPTQGGGKGYYFVGHHEIMIPLFFTALKERIFG